MNLKNKVAVITGAGTGIGQGIALAMANAGTSVVVDYVGKAELAQGAIDEITKSGGKVIGVDADISNPDDVANLIQKMECPIFCATTTVTKKKASHFGLTFSQVLES